MGEREQVRARLRRGERERLPEEKTIGELITRCRQFQFWLVRNRWFSLPKGVEAMRRPR